MIPVYAHAVVIGRFQPFHNGHLELLKRSLEVARSTIIVIRGWQPNGHKQTILNPFTGSERQRMVQSAVNALGPDVSRRVTVVLVREFPRQDDTWAEQVSKVVENITGNSKGTVLVSSSVKHPYNALFPKWEHLDLSDKTQKTSAVIRGDYFNLISSINPNLVPKSTLDFLQWYRSTEGFVSCQQLYLEKAA